MSSVALVVHDQQTAREQVLRQLNLKQLQYMMTQKEERRSRPPSAQLLRQIQLQESDSPYRWYNHRPADMAGPPVFIYEKAFSAFRENMSNHKPSSGELESAHRIIRQVLALRTRDQDQSQAFTKLNETLREAMGITKILHRDTQRHFPFSVFFAMKDEMDEDVNHDINIQNEDDYAATFLADTDQARAVRKESHCPAFLVSVVVGPYIGVSGAIFAEGLISQPLTDYISLFPGLNTPRHSAFDAALFRIAKLLFALKNGIQTLDARYSSILDGAASESFFAQPEFISPHFRAFQHPIYGPVVLRYIRRFKEPFERPVFLAEATAEGSASKPVIVKFAYKYNKDAHQLLAAQGLAPTLLYAEQHEDTGGLWVLVMEYVKSSNRLSLSSVQVQKLRNAVTALHHKGLVFGDLRRPNVLFDRDDNLKIIDFDWCGPAGQTRYPSDILLEEGKFHPDVQPGGVMQPEHDAYLFEVLTGERL